jgi:T5SS/PEP-CTERM-associated repeat protein
MTRARCLSAAIAAAAIFACSSSYAELIAWGAGGDGTSFSDADNWSPAAVPAANDEAIFQALGGSISVDLDPTTTALTIEDTLVTLAGSFTYTVIYDVSIDAPSAPAAGLELPGGTLRSERVLVGKQGTATLSIGGFVDTNRCIVGERAGGQGDVVISGAGAELTAAVVLLVGNQAPGSITASNGALLLTIGPAIVGTFVSEPNGSGEVIVTGADTQWIGLDACTVGFMGSGALSIADGGVVTTGEIAIVGDAAGSTGSVLVTGGGSTWSNTLELVVGRLGSGALAVTDGGTVVDMTGVLGAFSGSDGEATVTGAGSTWTNLLDLVISGYGTGLLTVGDGGVVAAPVVTINEGGAVYGDGGTLTGEVDNFGLISPGASIGTLTINGAYLQDEVGILEIELDEPAHDVLTVTGEADLAGTLNVSLANGFVPQAGQQFTILTANAVLGTFEFENVPPQISVTYQPQAVVLTVTTCLWDCQDEPDGSVSVVDFLTLLAQWGQAGASCDFDGGGVGVTDFLELLAHWGPCP